MATEVKAPSLAMELMDLSDHNLALAAQVGTEDIVAPYSAVGTDLSKMQKLKERVNALGMRLTVIERLLPHDKLVHGLPGRDEQLDCIKTLIRNMGSCGVKVLCYNWMQTDDWTRTSIDTKERGGALVTSFDADLEEVDTSGRSVKKQPATAQALWDNLKYFLTNLMPVCEESKVVLALHADDPPMPFFHGRPQIIYDIDTYVKAMKLVPHPCNGVCLAQGTLASGGVDIPKAIRTLAPWIKYIHFRDVVGTVPKFREAFQDTGKTDMVEAMRTYVECGVSVPLRPDHVPTLDSEDNKDAGYHILGRLWALGYIRGLRESVVKFRKESLTAANSRGNTSSSSSSSSSPSKRASPAGTQDDHNKKHKTS